MVEKTIGRKIYDLFRKRTSAGYGAKSVLATATKILDVQLNRSCCVIVNNSAQTVYLGFTNGVTTAAGIPIVAGGSYDNQVWIGEIWGIVAAGTANVRFEEFY